MQSLSPSLSLKNKRRPKFTLDMLIVLVDDIHHRKSSERKILSRCRPADLALSPCPANSYRIALLWHRGHCVVDYRHAMYTGWGKCQCQCACRVFARQWLGEWIITLHFLPQSLQSDHVKEIFFQVAGFP